MKISKKPTVLMFLFMALFGCKTEAQNNVLASKNGYQLTDVHLDIMVTLAEVSSNQRVTQQQKDILRDSLITSFNADPAGLTSEFAIVRSRLKELGYTFPETNQQPLGSQPINQSPNYGQSQPANQYQGNTTSSVGQGNLFVRQKLQNLDLQGLRHDTPAAANFRGYLANSQLNYGQFLTSDGYRSTGYRGSKSKVTFCPDGSFIEEVAASVSIDTESGSANSQSVQKTHGYWEVYAWPDGELVVYMYSDDQNWIRMWKSNLGALPIASYNNSYISLSENLGQIPRQAVNCGY